MALILNNTGKPKTPEVETSLQDKVKGFKFNLGGQTAKPVVKEVPKEKAVARTQPESPVVQAGNQIAKTNTPIPAMSDDKYEVVADSEATMSENAGDLLKQQIENLQSCIDGDGDLKYGMESVLKFLHENPEFKDMIGAEDAMVFVRACRAVAGITVTEKVVRKSKKVVVDKDVADIMAELGGLELNL